MRKITTLTTLLVIALTSSCALFQSERCEELEKFTPYFEGSVTPVSAPLELKYFPTSNSFQVQVHEKVKLSGLDICELFLVGRPWERMACVADVEKHPDQIETAKEERTLLGTTSVSHVGEDLEWDIKTLALSVDGKEWRPPLPINHVHLISNCDGKPSKIQISFPALEEAGIGDIPNPATREYSQAVNLFKQSILVLPEKPVVTGDVLHSVPVAEMVAEMLAFWGEQDKKQVLSVMEAGKDRLNYRVRGWSNFDQVQVLVTEVHYNGRVKISGKPMFIKNVGYVLLSANNGHVIKRENLSYMSYGQSEFIILYKLISEPRYDTRQHQDWHYTDKQSSW